MASHSGYGWEHSANCSNLRREGAIVKVDVSTSGSSYYSGTLYIDGTAVGSAWRSASGGSSSGSRTLEWNNPGAFSSRAITCRMIYQTQQSGGSNSDYLYPETGSLGAMTVIATFDDNYTGGSSTAKTETYDSAWVFPTTPIRTGYSFTGWNTHADGTGTTYSPGDTFQLTSAITLYAQWEAMSILHVVSGDSAKTITNIKVKDGENIRNIIGCYSVEDGVVRQGVK